MTLLIGIAVFIAAVAILLAIDFACRVAKGYGSDCANYQDYG